MSFEHITVNNRNNNPAVKSWLLLGLFWYFFASLSVPSLMGASTIGFLILIITLCFYREHFFSIYLITGPGWIMLLVPFISGAIITFLPGKSFVGLYDAGRAIVLFFSIVIIVTNSTQNQIIRSAVYSQFLLSAVVFSIFLFVSIQSGVFLLRYNPLLLKNIGNIHEFANLSVICLLVLLCLHASGAYRGKILFVLVLSMLVVIASTLSKSNFISIIICSIYLVIGVKYKRVWYLIIFLFVIVFIYYIFICAGDCNVPKEMKGTLLSRKEIYSDTLALVLKHPWFGYGINTFKYTSGIIHPSGDPFIMPHNIYLEQLYSWGIFGTVSFYLGLAVILRKENREISHINHSKDFLTTLGYTILVYSLSRGFLDFKFFSFHYLSLIIVSVALIISGGRYLRKNVF
jgi:O-antigen ligase